MNKFINQKPEIKQKRISQDQSKDVLNMHQQPSKFQLTSKKEYNIIKGDIKDLLKKANENTGLDIKTFATTLGIKEDACVGHNHIALLADIYSLNTKLDKILSIHSFLQKSKLHAAKSNLYVIRCNLLKLIHGLLPQAQAKENIIELQKYISKGFHATYNIEKILKYLDMISLETIDDFISLLLSDSSPDETKMTQDDKTNIEELLNLLTNHNLHCISGFKSAYSVYKQYLTLIVHTLKVSDPTFAKISSDINIKIITLSLVKC